MDENTLQFLAGILVEWGSAGADGAVLATILCRHFGKSWIDSKFATLVLNSDAPIRTPDRRPGTTRILTASPNPRGVIL